MRQIIFLGAGTPTPHKKGFGTAFFLDFDGHKILVDCGPSTTQKLAQCGFSPLDINSIFLTHLHFDHCSGMPDFLLSYWDQSISPQLDLKIYGPKASRRFVDRLVGAAGAFRDDINARINTPISQNTFVNRGGVLPRLHPRFIVNELAGGEVFQSANLLITTRKTMHSAPWLESLAYRFDADGLSIVVSGDTGSVNVIAELAAECDILIVNVWNANADVSLSRNDESLATVKTAALMAEKASARKLILAHLGKRSGQKGEKNIAECIAEASKIFSGKIVVAQEGRSIILQKSTQKTSYVEVI